MEKKKPTLTIRKFYHELVNTAYLEAKEKAIQKEGAFERLKKLTAYQTDKHQKKDEEKK